jgi:hypothetical protein
MRSEYKSFKEITRISSGTHFLDSGGESGRHWQRPLPPDHVYLWSVGENDLYASIPLHEHLDTFLNLSKKWNKILDDAEEDGRELFWVQECADFLVENYGYKIDSRPDNTYNNKNDLSQDFQWCVLVPEGENTHGEWYYHAENALVLIQVHTGADIRGGYTPTFVCEFASDDESYTLGFMDVVVGWGISSGVDEDGNELSDREIEKLSERWQTGYSSSPTSKFNGDIESVIEAKENGNEAKVKLKSGETVVVCPYASFEYA